MTYAIKKNGEWQEIFGSFKAVVEVNGAPDELSFPPNWLDLATEEDRAAIGAFPISEPEPVADGLRVIGDTIEGETFQIEIEVEVDGEPAVETIEIERPRRAWLTEAIPIEDAKAAKWARTKALRDAAIDGGIAVAGIGTFDSDPLSRSNINGAVTGALIAQAAAQPFAISWKLADNSIVQLDAAGMIAVGMAVLTHVAAVHAIAQGLGLAIVAAADFAELAAINIEADWPR